MLNHFEDPEKLMLYAFEIKTVILPVAYACKVIFSF